MKNVATILTLLLCLLSIQLLAQTDSINKKFTGIFPEGAIQPRMRVIIDNDFSGDPDGLFELVHFLLSPSVDIRAVIGSHLPENNHTPSNHTATDSKSKAEEVLNIMNIGTSIPIYAGSNDTLINKNTPQKSDAAIAIIKEAMRTDTQLPLYVVCGAGLTDIASAYLSEPKIADKLTLIWIGGPQYPGTLTSSVEASNLEYNMSIDLKAAQVIFNQSSIPIWQVPRSSYSQMIMPYSSILLKVKTQGKLGAYLANAIDSIRVLIKNFGFNTGEVYVIGDSPLVLLTALRSSFGNDPSSSEYMIRHCPVINDKGDYVFNKSGRNIKVFTHVDAHLTFEDFYSKLALFNQLQR